MVIAAAPAQAEENALVPATQAPVAGNPVNAQGNDRQFQQLFASWEALDQGRSLVSASASVSVPSRMPLDGARMTSDYGMRDHPLLRRRANHQGIDLAAPTGTPIYA
ncbi:MAG: M23 family metallopeptidase, partial [Qipengyuania sp.]